MTRTYNTHARARKERPWREYGARFDNPLAKWGGKTTNESSGFDNRGTRPEWRYRALKRWVDSGVPIRVAKQFAHLTYLSDAEAAQIAETGASPRLAQVAGDDDL